MSPTGIDESWGRADWQALKDAGVQVVSLYLSRDPSKNATATDVHAAHAHGIAVLLNWEGDSGAPLKGAAQGAADAQEWLHQSQNLIHQVGYGPRSKLSAVFSCDRDVSTADWPAIDAYYTATKRTLGGFARNGAYGEFDLIEHLHAAGLTETEWQTLAWSRGRVSGEADFYQESISNTLGGASVDFDRVVHAAQLGAWWPPGSPHDVPSESLSEEFVLDAEAKAAFAAVNDKLDRLATAIGKVNQREIAELNGDKDHPDAGLRDIADAVNTQKAA